MDRLDIYFQKYCCLRTFALLLILFLPGKCLFAGEKGWVMVGLPNQQNQNDGAKTTKPEPTEDGKDHTDGNDGTDGYILEVPPSSTTKNQPYVTSFSNWPIWMVLAAATLGGSVLLLNSLILCKDQRAKHNPSNPEIGKIMNGHRVIFFATRD